MIAFLCCGQGRSPWYCLAHLFLVICLAGACSDPAPPRANVVLITLDTTRADYLSCYGYKPGHTPNFDALAASGALFLNALSASAVTPVSHATILTGKFPYHHGLRVLSADSGFRLPAGERTLVSKLKAAGYRTLAVHSAFPVSNHFGFGRDFDVFESLEFEQFKVKWDMHIHQRSSAETTDRALAALQNATEPFFLWVHYWDPHDPLMMPPAEMLSDVQLDQSGRAVYNATNYERLYAHEVRYVDLQFGRLLEGLKQKNQFDNTIFVVTADHGEGLLDGDRDHGWDAHRMVYQEQLHVPLILAGPGVSSAKTIRELVRTVDIVPTLEDYLGLAIDETLDGASLRPLVEGLPSPARIAYADQINGYDLNSGLGNKRPEAQFLYCIVDGDWKLIYRPHMPERSELFNLANDPDEVRDLKGQEREQYERLLLELAKRRNCWVLEQFVGRDESLPDVSELLQSTGYSGSELVLEQWVWTCPKHLTHRQETPDSGQHEACGSPLLPVAR